MYARNQALLGLAVVVLAATACGGPGTSTRATPQAADRSPWVGQTMTLEGERLDGEAAPFSLADVHGKVVIVDFWASWCGPCRDALPWYEELYGTHRDGGLEVVAVSVDEQRDAAERFLDALELSYTVVWDDGHQLAERYQLEAMPTTFVLDRSGVIRAVHGGFREETKGETRALVEALLAEAG